MTALAVVLLVAAVAATGSLFLLPVRKPRQKMAWWRLRAVHTNVDEVSAALALAGMYRRRSPRLATLVRRGATHGSSDLWLGVRAPAVEARRHAEALAVAAGCEIGEPGVPPPMEDTGLRWWMSHTEKDKDALETTIHSEMHEQRTSFAERFADHADSKLGPDDAFVLSVVPHRNRKECYARVATTSEDMAHAWTAAAPPVAKRMPLSPAEWVCAGAAVLGAFIGAVGFGVAGLPAGGHGVLGAAAAVVASVGALRALRSPRSAQRVARWSHLSLSQRLRKRTSALPSGSIAGWAAGGSLTAVEATQRLAPDAVTEQEGAYIGVDPVGRACWLPDSDRQWGVFCVGDPGTGKTTFLLNLVRADVQARLAGAQRSLLWVETKGEGARRVSEVVENAGWTPCVIQAASSEGLRLELVDWDNPKRSAQLLTDAMQYAYEADAIRAHSEAVLQAVFTAAISLPPAGAAELGFSGRQNVMQLAWWLLGGDQTSRAPERARAVCEKYCGEAYNPFAFYLPPQRTKRDSQQALDAPLNKVFALLSCSGLFEVGQRQWTTLDRLISEHHVTVLDMSPVPGGVGYTESTATRVAAMLLYCIWDAVKTHCDSWQEINKSVALYSDELHDIARAGFADSDKEVVQTMADTGRSRGLLPVFATQRPGQLPRDTAEAVRSFGSQVYFRLKNTQVAEEVSADLLNAYSIEEVMSLSVGECVAKLTRGGPVQPAFTLYPENL